MVKKRGKKKRKALNPPGALADLQKSLAEAAKRQAAEDAKPKPPLQPAHPVQPARPVQPTQPPAQPPQPRRRFRKRRTKEEAWAEQLHLVTSQFSNYGWHDAGVSERRLWDATGTHKQKFDWMLAECINRGLIRVHEGISGQKIYFLSRGNASELEDHDFDRRQGPLVEEYRSKWKFSDPGYRQSAYSARERVREHYDMEIERLEREQPHRIDRIARLKEERGMYES